MRKIGLCGFLGIALATASARAAAPIDLEHMTTVELKQRLSAGCPVAILFNGSTEETGPHVALGKHNVRARKYGLEMVRALDDAILAPLLPFAPNAPAALGFAGTIALKPETYMAVNEEVARSLIGGGFRRVALLGDHGGGQAQLEEIADRLDAELRGKNVRVFFISDVYDKARRQIEAEIKAMGRVPGGHGGLWDTAETMAADPGEVRPMLFAPGNLAEDGNGPIDANGISGDPRGATAALGRRFGAIRVRLAVAELRAALAAAGPCR